MYRVTNRRNRRTTLALPGRGIHLNPLGSRGDSALLLDDEIDEDDVKAKLSTRPPAIEVTRVDPSSNAVVDLTESMISARRRIASRRSAETSSRKRRLRRAAAPAPSSPAPPSAPPELSATETPSVPDVNSDDRPRRRRRAREED